MQKLLLDLAAVNSKKRSPLESSLLWLSQKQKSRANWPVKVHSVYVLSESDKRDQSLCGFSCQKEKEEKNQKPNAIFM